VMIFEMFSKCLDVLYEEPSANRPFLAYFTKIKVGLSNNQSVVCVCVCVCVCVRACARERGSVCACGGGGRVWARASPSR
jgi:hypothetical protein